MTKVMLKGVLKTWKEDRGFGFIKPDNGKRDVFIHISSLKGASRRPVVGDVIYYQIAKDSRGKFKAVRAHIEGVAIIEMERSQNFRRSKNQDRQQRNYCDSTGFADYCCGCCDYLRRLMARN